MFKFLVVIDCFYFTLEVIQQASNPEHAEDIVFQRCVNGEFNIDEWDGIKTIGLKKLNS